MKDNMLTEYEVPEVSNYKCYKLGNILYIPHYHKPFVFVGPSVRTLNYAKRPEFTARYFYKNELLKLGASEITEMLWSTSARNEK